MDGFKKAGIRLKKQKNISGENTFVSDVFLFGDRFWICFDSRRENRGEEKKTLANYKKVIDVFGKVEYNK